MWRFTMLELIVAPCGGLVSILILIEIFSDDKISDKIDKIDKFFDSVTELSQKCHAKPCTNLKFSV